MTDIHSLFGVKLDSAVVGGIETSSLPFASTTPAEPTDDSPYSYFVSLNAQRPSASWTSKALGDMLAALPLTGFDMATGAGLSMYAQKRLQGGTRSAGATHREYQIVHGVTVLRTLSCDHQQDAMLMCEAGISYDGTNDPVVVVDNASLPTIPDHQQRFTIGPVTIGGVTIDKVRSVSIDFGIQLDIIGADSDIWPTHASISQIVPTMTLRGLDSTWFSSGKIPLTGRAGVQADTEVFFRKRALGGDFVADNVAEHVLISMNGLATITEANDATTNAPGEVSLQLTSYADTGSDVPIVITPAAAIAP